MLHVGHLLSGDGALACTLSTWRETSCGRVNVLVQCGHGYVRTCGPVDGPATAGAVVNGEFCGFGFGFVRLAGTRCVAPECIAAVAAAGVMTVLCPCTGACPCP